MLDRIMTIYLSGGIKDLTDEQAYGWRKKVKEYYLSYPVRVIIPSRIQYRSGYPLDLEARWLVKRDKACILSSDIVLAYCPKPSWGTGMELIFAHENGIWVVVITEDPDPSPWLLAHSDSLVGTFEEAYKEIERMFKEMGMTERWKRDLDP